MGMSIAFLAVLWTAHSVAFFEEIWNVVASSGLYSQTPHPFWWVMAGCIAIGSLATTVDWLVSFTLHEPITCSSNCVIEKGFSWRWIFFSPILTSISRRSTRSHISGNRGYNSNWVRLPLLIKSLNYVLNSQEILEGSVAGTFPDTTFFVLLHGRKLVRQLGTCWSFINFTTTAWYREGSLECAVL